MFFFFFNELLKFLQHNVVLVVVKRSTGSRPSHACRQAITEPGITRILGVLDARLNMGTTLCHKALLLGDRECSYLARRQNSADDI